MQGHPEHMTDAPFSAPQNTVETEALREKLYNTRKVSKSGANWYYWIAGLSLANGIMLATETDWGFIFGLGTTQVMQVLLSENATMGFLSILPFAGIFIAIGYWAGRPSHVGYITGMILYALDGLIYVIAEDWLNAGFHAFALFLINVGRAAIAQTARLEAELGQKNQTGISGFE